jgi:hypothetical protein
MASGNIRNSHIVNNFCLMFSCLVVRNAHRLCISKVGGGVATSALFGNDSMKRILKTEALIRAVGWFIQPGHFFPAPAIS